jgi:hypothetical protein
MILAGHQPYYLPWPGFFYKMYHADHFILADSFQYSKHSYTNRTKIKTTAGTCWLTVPVTGIHSAIKDIKIVNDSTWQHKHWQTLRHTYKHTYYFDHYAGLFEQIYTKKWTFLIDLTYTLILEITKVLQISTSITFASELNLSTGDIKQMLTGQKCDSYLTEREYNTRKFIGAENTLLIYRSYPDISIIDALFHSGPEAKYQLNFTQKPHLCP